MRHNFLKLMALLMVLALVLTGCNLLDVDTVALIEKERSDLEDFYTSIILAEYDGGTVTEFDAMATFYSNYSYYYELYSYFGIEYTSDMATDLVESAVDSEIQAYAISLQFESRGLELDYTDEEILEEANEYYDSYVEYYLDYVDGDTDEEKTAYAELELYAEGITAERYYELLVASYQYDVIEETLLAEITEVTDEEMEEAYEEEVEADSDTYTDSPTDIESDATDEDEIIAWYPEGYRTVKHILVIPEDEYLDAVTDARDAVETAEEELEELYEELDELYDDDEEEEDEETEDEDEETEETEDEETEDEDTEETEDEETEETEDEETEDEETEETEDEETEDEETEETEDEETEDEEAEETEDEETEDEDEDTDEDEDEDEDEEESRTEEEILADIEAKEEELAELEEVAAEAEEACLASVQDTLDEIYALLEEGEDFDTVMAEYGEDPGMQSDPAMTTGYYVSADSTTWDENFTAGAMLLESVGDYSETPVISTSGVHIIYYNSDVTPGAVDLEDIYDALYDQTLETLKEEHFESELESWIEDLNVVYYLDNWSYDD